MKKKNRGKATGPLEIRKKRDNRKEKEFIDRKEKRNVKLFTKREHGKPRTLNYGCWRT